MNSIEFILPSFSTSSEEKETFWKRFSHKALLFDHWCKRFMRKEKVRKKRLRRKHRVTFKRKKLGLVS